MNRAKYFAIAIVAVLACSGKQAPSPTARDEALQIAAGPLDDTVRVQLGGSALTRDRSLQLTYVRLVSESRCPANAICVWQGDAAVRIAARAVGAAMDTTIHTALDPKVIAIGSNQVSLLEVQPYPGAGDSKNGAYIVARVVRQGDR